jgi:peptidoglycan/xylan/chitin deacetylase (PgdA/CDA1 family)
VQIAHGPRTVPNVALTFHGSGDIGLAREVLAIARTEHAALTVMAVGVWLSANPGIGREILAGGHDLGNHTLRHVDINSLPPQGMRQEVVGCRNILLRTTGHPGSYFRQSQSQTANAQLLGIVGPAGYRVCLSYDLDSMDWTDPGAQAVRDNLAAARPGSIVSMHLGHRGTVEALPAILGDLAARGLHAVTVTTLLAS